MLDLLRLFVQIVEEQSFTVVARRLGVSQPAVSNQMRALEEKLGVKLLNRKGKGFSLSPQGAITYEHAKKLLSQWEQLQKDLGHCESHLTGNVHLGASHIPGEYLLPAQIACLRQECPDIRFRITIGDSLEIAEKVAAQVVDFAVIGADFNTDKLTSELWLQDELGLVFAVDHPLNEYAQITLDDLHEFSMVVREPGSGHRRALEEALAKEGLSIEDFYIGLEVGSTEAVKNAVRSGLGYSFISKSALDYSGSDGLRWVKVENFEIKRGFYLVSRRNRALNHVARYCYRFLASQGMST